MHSCPHHDWIPCVDIRNDMILFSGRMTAVPQFPFLCTIADEVEWFTAEEAEDRGLIHVAFEYGT